MLERKDDGYVNPDMRGGSEHGPPHDYLPEEHCIVKKQKMEPWTPETHPATLRRVGKLGEEAAELSKVCFRIVTQGSDGVDPRTKQSNVEELKKEIADVYAQLDETVAYFLMCADFIEARRAHKRQLMEEWEEHFK